ncbi:hypothetical protein [Amycolatopsis sp. lyj-346]|uniref:hypothetical protein n=1 Tax=Amycolatopsis sp. lyj-346 TaxID=2789289 RepID=UPI003978B719
MPHQFQGGFPCPRGTFAGRTAALVATVRVVFAALLFGQPVGKVGGEQVGEGFSQVRAVHLVINDPEAREDGLVELATDGRWCAEVEPVRVDAQQQCFFDHLHDGFDLH